MIVRGGKLVLDRGIPGVEQFLAGLDLIAFDDSEDSSQELSESRCQRSVYLSTFALSVTTHATSNR